MADETDRDAHPEKSFHVPYGTLNYQNYLKVPELLQLQKPQTDPPAHDEMLFIVIHQAYELWFKLALYELDAVGQWMDSDDPFEATRLLGRVHKIENLLVHQIHVLETMTPRDFLAFRSALNPASGFQSIQFRELEFVSGLKNRRVLKALQTTQADLTQLEKRLDERSLRTRYYELLRRKGLDVVVPGDGEQLEGEALEQTLSELRKIFAEPEHYNHLYSLAEALVQHDQNMLLWRYHHVRVVERLIGSKLGTGGSAGVRYLESTLTQRAFPMLWYVRGTLSDDEFYGRERGRTSYDDL